MPDEADHFTQAEKNKQVADFLAANSTVANRYSQWEVVTMFYSALHYVDAFLATKGIHPPDHITRNGHVAIQYELKPISNNYQNLYHRSKDARYRLKEFPQHVVDTMETNLFEPIKTRTYTLLGRP